MQVRLSARTALVVVCALALWAAPAQAAYSIVASPNAFSGDNVLNGVSARSSTDAWAVGSLCCSARHAGLGTLTEHWNGSTWSVVPSPDTLFNDEVLSAATDLGPSNAWAVGLIKQSGFRSGVPLIIHWNGSTWSTMSIPTGVTGTLSAVSADAANDVWAVGNDAHGHAIALHYNGIAWASSPLPNSVATSLQGVKAFSPSDVWAVGLGVPNPLSTFGQTVVVHWNGTAWSVVPSPNPDPSVDILEAVDGLSSSNLWAVGQQGRSETTTGVPPGTRTLTEHWNGRTWTVVPSLNTADEDVLSGVAALSPTSVATVGTDVATGGPIPIQRTLAERWNGSSWLPQVTANTGPTDNLLRAVATIPGSPAVWAVGFSLSAANVDRTLIERGVG